MENGVSVALQLSGHLRGLCDSSAHFDPLVRLVAACRRAAKRCDLFVHTWDELHAQTPTWHTWYPSDNPKGGASSKLCLERLRAELQPTAVAVERQTPSRTLGNATWIVVAGRHQRDARQPDGIAQRGARGGGGGGAAACSRAQRPLTSV